MTHLIKSEIDSMGFEHVGENAYISDRASFYNCTAISIGNNVRIDDFCIISAGIGGIHIGSHVHIAAYTSLIGAASITLSDFCGLSSRVSIYSSSDDYSGNSLTNSTIPDQFKNVANHPVYLGRHVIVGCGSVILPGIRLDDGVSIGALSLVNRSCDAFGVYAGQPARYIKAREQKLLALEVDFLASLEK